MTELYSLERPERVRTLEEALGIAADIIDCEKTHEQCEKALADGMTTEYIIRIGRADDERCKVSVISRLYSWRYEIKFMNGLEI